MNTSRPQLVRKIFMDVVELAADQRPAALVRLCTGDDALRAEVQILLDADLAAGNFMASPTASAARRPTAELPITEAVGTTIGPYKLLELIGEGGFGSVFMAEQRTPVARKVALKIIKLGMDTKAVAARFDAERQALAMMDHPHIARVFDGGITPITETGGGRPYFVMEYVRGTPITPFAREHRLSIGARLDLFMQVCLAVQHAHTKGIIHRDLKPANVLVSMVDGKPFAKVIDFGIAKSLAARLTEQTLFTEHRMFIGTPEYMSPEQAEGSPDIDTRADIYGLGVLLYELLTGLTPFDGTRLRSAAYQEMQRIIKEEDPPKPSLRVTQGVLRSPTLRVGNSPLGTPTLRVGTSDSGGTDLGRSDLRADSSPADPAAKQASLALSRQLQGELDWIVMKALDKDRARRYETASAFADDIGRHLVGEPVVAAPPSAGYRLRKFVRKHRGPVIAGSAIAAVLLIGIAGTTWQWRRTQTLNIELRDREEMVQDGLGQIILGSGELRGLPLHVESSPVEPENRRAELKSLITLALEAKTKSEANAALAQQRATEAERNAQLAREKTAEAEFESYIGNITAAQAAIEVRDISTARRRLEACAPSLRNWEWKWLNARLDSSLAELEGSNEYLNHVAIDASQKMLIGTSYSGKVSVWNLETTRAIQTFVGEKESLDYGAFLPGARSVALRRPDGTVLVGDIATGSTREIFTGEKVVWETGTSSRGDMLFTDGEPAGIHRLLNVPEGRQITLTGEMPGEVSQAAFSPDGSLVMIALKSGRVRLWDTSTGEIRLTLERSPATGYTAAAFSPDGGSLALAYSHAEPHGDIVEIVQTTTGQTISMLKKSEEGGVGVDCICFSALGDTIATLHSDFAIVVWDVETGSKRGQISKVAHWWKTSVVFGTFYGQLLVTSQDGTVSIWDPDAGFELSTIVSPSGTVSSAMYFDEDRKIITVGDCIRVWDARWTPKPTLPWRSARLLAPRSSAAKRIYAGNYANPIEPPGSPKTWEYSINVLNGDTDEVIAELPTQGNPVDYWLSNDGRFVAAICGDYVLRVWSIETRECLASLNDVGGGAPAEVAFAPDSKTIAVTWGKGKCEIVNWRERSRVHVFDLDGSEFTPRAMAFSRDGSTLAVRTYKGDIYLLSTSTFETQAILHDTSSYTGCIAFSPDGSRIATVSESNTAKVWDRATGKELITIRLEYRPEWIAFSADGSQIITQQPNAVYVGGDWRDSAQVWDSVPYRQRYPEIEKRETLVDDIRQKAESRLQNGESFDAVRKGLLAEAANSPATLEAVQEVCDDREEWADELNTNAWKVVMARSADAKELELAMAWARYATELMPNDTYHINTLGATQYRAGHFHEALKTLMQAAELNAKAHTESSVDWVLIAMCQWKLASATGEAPKDAPADEQGAASSEQLRAAARESLAKARALMAPAADGTPSEWAEDEDAKTLLAEAAALIEGADIPAAEEKK